MRHFESTTVKSCSFTKFDDLIPSIVHGSHWLVSLFFCIDQSWRLPQSFNIELVARGNVGLSLCPKEVRGENMGGRGEFIKYKNTLTRLSNLQRWREGRVLWIMNEEGPSFMCRAVKRLFSGFHILNFHWQFTQMELSSQARARLQEAKVGVNFVHHVLWVARWSWG